MDREKRYVRPNYRQVNTCANCYWGSVFMWFDGSEDIVCSYDRYIKSDPLNKDLDIMVDASSICDNYRKLGETGEKK